MLSAGVPACIATELEGFSIATCKTGVTTGLLSCYVLLLTGKVGIEGIVNEEEEEEEEPEVEMLDMGIYELQAGPLRWFETAVREQVCRL